MKSELGREGVYIFSESLCNLYFGVVVMVVDACGRLDLGGLFLWSNKDDSLALPPSLLWKRIVINARDRFMLIAMHRRGVGGERP